ncbi:hypothetical protein SDC9_60372 [bioreactor metagenome]|uniref:Uncharacterized protein n=1 Tax=bioreactor metagenome TaxID=1076179 RepID=A0A644XCV5_9ZZZZ
MSLVFDLHKKAMEYSQQALLARANADESLSSDLYNKALKCEIEAISNIPKNTSSEPTLSILISSAASLAYKAGDTRLAYKLSKQGLQNSPPEYIRNNLNIILSTILRESFELKNYFPTRRFSSKNMGHQPSKIRRKKFIGSISSRPFENSLSIKRRSVVKLHNQTSIIGISRRSQEPAFSSPMNNSKGKVRKKNTRR